MKTLQKRKLPIKNLLYILALIPISLAIGYSTVDAVRGIIAAHTLDTDQFKNSSPSDSQELLKLRRKIQKHFINTGVYVPMEDIVFVDKSTKGQRRLNFLMQKACGAGKLYVWIPLKFKWPIIGERVFDWCWKA